MQENSLFSVKHFNTVSSTNTLAKELAKEGEKEFTVILADSQTAGRGRLSRSFFSNAESGIYMSIILRPHLSFEDTNLITAAAAVAVCKALENVCRVSSQIKWVNDIYLRGKKVCGILTEAAVNAAAKKPDFAVLGIGINLCEDNFPPEIKDIAGAVFSLPPNEQTKERLINEILSEFYNIYINITERKFMDDYRKRSLITGKKIVFERQGETFYGTAEKIGDDAKLTVVLENGERCILYSGEVSVRLA